MPSTMYAHDTLISKVYFKEPRSVLGPGPRAEANGGPGVERPPGDHLSENFPLLSEIL